jgi:hypothetical protein
MGALWIPVAVSTWVLLRPPVTAAPGLAALVVVPSYWLVIEWIRSWQGFGGPWALLGASQWQASGGARAGRGGRGVAGQLRHRGGQHRHRDPADRRARPGPGPGRGRRRGRDRGRAGRVRAHPPPPAPGAVP